MTERVATTPGLFPLPDWAKETLSDLKGHQKGDLLSGNEGPEIVSTYADVRSELIDDQLDAGLDRIVEGQARWDDMIAHPLTVADGVETGGIVRYYDNNNFYRDPRVVSEPTASGDVAEELASASDQLPADDDVALQAVLPGPYSLSELATNETGADAEAFRESIAAFLAAEVEALGDHETLFLLEPSLVEQPPEDGVDAQASDAIDRVASATDADVVVHTYWGAIPEKPYAHLLDADIDAVGLDLVTGDRDDSVYNVQEYGAPDSVALGVVDGQNTLVEEPETIAERVGWFEEQLPVGGFETTYVTSNTELFYLPENKYQAKLNALAAGVEVLS
ncbi:5-methyltetrahydropteroyltriglutamate--homocysteine methyltransferase [Halopenitus malekzadehii]|uniref:5-methyltetrahydropteroyltriglutamate--homocysteine methyltransferase n=1 Tax=Halopenitus malekzadehii TaxID=1267564 RepID=A0A1H6JK24_9EURY|nr:5-methyltetrahydropteroyltriglutamate--homocysteine methyltransferase [Halopenitus malekzadehii]SEH62724.1 5-methyltetrahydropteroyltriglutamate--homocysteine methyltransferase [Halopenitus malekzadehii]